MKSVYKLCAAALVAVFAVSCSKGDGNVKVFRANAEPATEDGKVTYSGSRLLWQAGDEISIYDASSNAAVYGLASGANTANAEYTHSSGAEIALGPYTAVYPAAIRTGANTVSLPEVQHTPDGSLTGLPMYAVSDNMELHFYNLCGVVRFRLSASSAVSVSRIAVCTDLNINGSATITGSGTSVSISTPTGNNVSTLSCQYGQSISSAHDFYMYLPAGTYSTFRILMTAADGSLCSKSANRSIVVERGKITTITLSNLSFIAHRFSTSSTTSVVFSPGNLQYIGSAATPYWKFADRQTDYFGTTTGQNSAAINVDRDLFGWGTSGWSNDNTYYQPYDTYGSPSYENYGPVGEYNLTGDYANADWGVYNRISNGGNTVGMWRTLTKAEWTYIGNTRTTSTVGGTENSRWVFVNVNNLRGMMLFPDSYTQPDGVAIPQSINGSGIIVISEYSVSDLFSMESAGVVFLPEAGYRSGRSIYCIEQSANYWSSTCNGADAAYHYSFGTVSLDPRYIFRSLGFSVRLVKD